jgi:hypothetical protein
MAAGTPKKLIRRPKLCVLMSLLAVLLILPWLIGMFRSQQPAGAWLDIDPLTTGKGLRALKALPNLQVDQPLGPTHSVQATGRVGDRAITSFSFRAVQVVPSIHNSFTDAKSIATRSNPEGS